MVFPSLSRGFFHPTAARIRVCMLVLASVWHPEAPASSLRSFHLRCLLSSPFFTISYLRYISSARQCTGSPVVFCSLSRAPRRGQMHRRQCLRSDKDFRSIASNFLACLRSSCFFSAASSSTSLPFSRFFFLSLSPPPQILLLQIYLSLRFLLFSSFSPFCRLLFNASNASTSRAGSTESKRARTRFTRNLTSASRGNATRPHRTAFPWAFVALDCRL